MKLIKETGKDGLATVYIGETDSGKRVEFVESLQPPLTRDEKWVLIVSSLSGCPIECEMCDAGGSYHGKLTADDITQQIDHMVLKRYPDKIIPAKKFKIQFARVGEPSLNNNVLAVLRKLPTLYKSQGLLPTLSTVAPVGSDDFFEELLQIKTELYPEKFQLQFSIHSTNESKRDRIIPIKKWSLQKIAEYGSRFHNGGKKITLNFVMAENYTIDTRLLRSVFSPDAFFIKMTPLNPTYRAHNKGVETSLSNEHLSKRKEPEIAGQLRDLGYDVLVSIGELEENLIGSNCGQYIKTFEEYSKQGKLLEKGYSPWRN